MATCSVEDLNLVAPVPSTGPKSASTRGARRRLQQRARRRRGKLERRALASTTALPGTYGIADMPLVVPAIMEVEGDNVNSIQHFAQDAKYNLMEVPVCAAMVISQLEEDESSLEMADVFITLPNAKPLPRQPAQSGLPFQKLVLTAPPTNPPPMLLAQDTSSWEDTSSWAEDIDQGSTGFEGLALENVFFQGHQSIPAIRTFVHFPNPLFVGAYRRAQSV